MAAFGGSLVKAFKKLPKGKNGLPTVNPGKLRQELKKYKAPKKKDINSPLNWGTKKTPVRGVGT